MTWYNETVFKENQNFVSLVLRLIFIHFQVKTTKNKIKSNSQTITVFSLEVVEKLYDGDGNHFHPSLEIITAFIILE